MKNNSIMKIVATSSFQFIQTHKRTFYYYQSSFMIGRTLENALMA